MYIFPYHYSLCKHSLSSCFIGLFSELLLQSDWGQGFIHLSYILVHILLKLPWLRPVVDIYQKWFQTVGNLITLKNAKVSKNRFRSSWYDRVLRYFTCSPDLGFTLGFWYTHTKTPTFFCFKKSSWYKVIIVENGTISREKAC